MRRLLHPRHAAPLVQRIRGDYSALPGLRLTAVQARRLWDADARQCSSVLDALVEAGFLHRTDEGLYARAHLSLPASRLTMRGTA